LDFLKEKRHPTGICGADGFEGEHDAVYFEAAKKFKERAERF
jgi:hypothetical protein